MENNLKRKTLISLSSSYLMQFITQAIQVISRIILARLLAPDDFGLFALAFLILNIAKVFVQLGLGPYVIREEKINYGALFVLEIIAGALAFIVLGMITPLLYGYNVALPPIHKILTFALIPYCISAIPLMYGFKELEIKRMLVPNILNYLTFGIVAIILSLKALNVLALVYAQLASEVIFAVSLWIVFRHRIPLDFKFKAREVFKPAWGAKYFFAMAAFSIFATSADKAILGKMVSLKEVGYYALSMTFAMFVCSIVDPAVNSVFPPLFSKIKKDMKKTSELYALSTKILYWLKIPVYLFFFFNADVIVRIILGKNWIPAIPFFRLLAILPIIDPCGFFGWQILQVHRMERIQFIYVVIKLFLFAMFGWFFVNSVGALGIIWARYCVYLFGLTLLYFTNKVVKNVIPVFIRLLPIYGICLVGLTLIYIIFKNRVAAFLLSFIYILSFYIMYYKCQIARIIKEKFADVELFKRLKIV